MIRTFELNATPSLRVSIAGGSVEIDTADGPTARVEVTREDGSEPGDDVFVGLRETTSGPEIAVELKRGGFWGVFSGDPNIVVRADVPHSSRLHVTTASADIAARGRYAGSVIETASGDARVEHVDGNLSIKSASGDLDVESVSGDLDARTASGETEIGHCGGDVSVRTASGDIKLGQVHGGQLEARTASGGVDIADVSRGSLSINTASGEIAVGVRRGSHVWLDTRSLSGDTTSELEVTEELDPGEGELIEIRATSVSGAIRIRRSDPVAV